MDTLSSLSMTPPALLDTSQTDDKVTMQDEETTLPSPSQAVVTLELELPVLRDGGNGAGRKGEDERGKREGEVKIEENVIRSEIPDSEADTEDAVSPVKSVRVEARWATDADGDGDQSPRGGEGVQRGESEVQPGQNDDTLDTAQADSLVTRANDENPQSFQSTEPYVTVKKALEGDREPVPLIDDDSMIVLPKFTSTDQQPATQDETVAVDSCFEDGMAVISDVGGLEEGVAEGGVEVGDGEKILEEPLVEGKDDVQLLDVPTSSPEETRAQAGSAMESGNAANELEDGEDVVMSDEPVPEEANIENSKDQSSPEGKNETGDVEMQQASVPDISSTASTAALSIPDSDDDEELPDGPSPPKETQEQVIASTMTTNASTIENVTANKRDSQATEVSSSPPKLATTLFKPSASPTKMPNTSFKPTTLSKTTNSQLSEPISSPPISEVPRSSASESEKKKSPTGSFKAPEGFQNKDILMAELKAMKIASIQARNASLEAEIAGKKAKLEEVSKELANPAAETVKRHIKLLHDYNDIRDVGQGLIGMIADNRGVRIGELYEEFGVGLKD